MGLVGGALRRGRGGGAGEDGVRGDEATAHRRLNERRRSLHERLVSLASRPRQRGGGGAVGRRGKGAAGEGARGGGEGDEGRGGEDGLLGGQKAGKPVTKPKGSFTWNVSKKGLSRRNGEAGGGGGGGGGAGGGGSGAGGIGKISQKSSNL